MANGYTSPAGNYAWADYGCSLCDRTDRHSVSKDDSCAAVIHRPSLIHLLYG